MPSRPWAPLTRLAFDREADPAAQNVPRPCDFCQRTQSADMLHCARPLLGVTLPLHFFDPSHPRHDGERRWMCDGCRETLHRDGWLLREDWYALHGAPPKYVGAIAAHAAIHDPAPARARAPRYGGAGS